MDDLLKEMDDTNSDTSIIDFNLASDDEEIIFDNPQPIQEIQNQEEVIIQEGQIIQEQAQITQNQQNYFDLTHNEKLEENNVISLPVQHNKFKPKLIKPKQPRECNLRQGYQIIKTFGSVALTSYKNVQQQKELALMKVTNYILQGVDKLKRL